MRVQEGLCVLGAFNVISLYFVCCSVNGYVCLVCYVSDSVSELFAETIRNIFGVGYYFIVKCFGGVLLDIPWMVFQIMRVLFVPVIPVCI